MGHPEKYSYVRNSPKHLRLKKILIKDQDAKNIRKKFDLIKNLNHPNLIQLYDLIEDCNFYYIIMEYEENGNLKNYILSNKTNVEANSNIIEKYIYQLVDVLCYLQQKEVIHKNIKPENILIDTEGNLKISDFLLDKENSTNTSLYKAPEFLIREENLDMKIDVWSMGYIFYELAVGKFRLEGNSEIKIYKSIMEKEINLTGIKDENIKSIIQMMLIKEKNNRFLMSDIKLKKKEYFDLLKKNLEE